MVVNTGHHISFKRGKIMRKTSTTINKRDVDALEFIKGFMLKNGVTPTVREISEGLGIKSAAAAHLHLQNLIKFGYIIPYGENGSRYVVKGIKMVEDKQ